MKTPKGEINDKVFELIKDEETLTKMSACKSPEACYEVVKEKIDIDFEDFKQSMTIVHRYLQEYESGLLTDEELDQVAGGRSHKGTTTTTDLIVLAVGSVVGVAVGAVGGVAIMGATAAAAGAAV